MHGPMDLQTDGPTEIPSYRDARTHVKMGWNHFLSFLVARPMMLNQHFAFRRWRTGGGDGGGSGHNISWDDPLLTESSIFSCAYATQ